MEIRQSKTITAGCDRIKKQIEDVIKQNAHIIEKELHKKILLLEFYYKELLSRKEKLTSHVSQLLTIKERIQHSIESMRYPKEICNQCIEIRQSVSQLQHDSVQTELKRENHIIDQTELHFKDLVNKLQEQIRKYRATIYALEADSRRKSNTLKIEKSNKTIKISDSMDINLYKLIQENRTFAQSTGTHNFDWEEESKDTLTDADLQYDAGMKLQICAEESLLRKMNALIAQHNLCNEAFNHRVATYKDKKDSLELKCRQINEEICQQKLNIRNIEDMMTENECHIKLAQIRLDNRTESTYAELSKDNVEAVLLNELKRLNSARNKLRNKWSEAISSLKSLNEKKKQYDVEIQAKTDVIKVDEVECLPLRSSIHYYTY